MGAYIGSMLAKLGGSYLDEREAQTEKRRKEQEASQQTTERQSAFNRLLSSDAFQREKYGTEREDLLRERQQKEADRQEFPSRFKAAQSGDEESLGWVLERYPQMASALTRPDPSPKNPIMGSPEWKEAKKYEASIAPQPVTYLQGMGEQGPEYFAAPTRQGGTPKATGIGTVPKVGRAAGAGVKLQSELRDVDVRLRNIDNALDQVTANPDAFGLKHFMPDAVRERLPWRDAGVDATTVGSLEYVVGELRKDRFGGALTPLEASKADKIFSNPKSPPDVITAQLNVLRNAIASKKNAIAAQLDAMGGGGQGSGEAPAGRIISRSDYNALVLANGKAQADALLKASNARVNP